MTKRNLKMVRRVDVVVDGRVTDECVSWERAVQAVEELDAFIKEHPEQGHNVELKLVISAAKLEEDTKKRMRQILGEHLMGVMFGDGLEQEYIMGGVDFKGLDNMTDDELLKEWEESGVFDEEDDESEEYELWCQAKEQLERT